MSAENIDEAAKLVVKTDGDGRVELDVTTKFADVKVYMSREQAVAFATAVITTANRLGPLKSAFRGAVT